MDYSVDKPIWPGSSSFSPGDTPFGFFDNDSSIMTRYFNSMQIDLQILQHNQ
jgi:hypothetical protein